MTTPTGYQPAPPALEAAALASGHPHALLFASVCGSKLYGFDRPDSDRDVRGAHVIPAELALGIDEPGLSIIGRHQGMVSMERSTREVRKCFGMLLNRNGKVPEEVLSPLTVVAEMDVRILEQEGREMAKKKDTPEEIINKLREAAEGNFWASARRRCVQSGRPSESRNGEPAKCRGSLARPIAMLCWSGTTSGPSPTTSWGCPPGSAVTGTGGSPLCSDLAAGMSTTSVWSGSGGGRG